MRGLIMSGRLMLVPCCLIVQPFQLIPAWEDLMGWGEGQQAESKARLALACEVGKVHVTSQAL